jgi:hypothetical protein
LLLNDPSLSQVRDVLAQQAGAAAKAPPPPEGDEEEEGTL